MGGDSWWFCSVRRRLQITNGLKLVGSFQKFQQYVVVFSRVVFQAPVFGNQIPAFTAYNQQNEQVCVKKVPSQGPRLT